MFLYLFFNLFLHKLHGEKFGGSARPTRRSDALNTQRAARPLFSRKALPIWGYHYHKMSSYAQYLGQPFSRKLCRQFGVTSHTKPKRCGFPTASATVLLNFSPCGDTRNQVNVHKILVLSTAGSVYC